MSNVMTFVDERSYGYMLNHATPEADILADLRKETHEAMGTAAVMQICPEQGQLMAMLVKLMGARRIVEVGTFTGYSSLAMALAARQTRGDDWTMLCCDVSEPNTRLAKAYWQQAGVAENIELVLAPAQETLAGKLANGWAGTADMVFIDADKAGYLTYYEQAIELLRSGGLVLVDNVLWDGEVANPVNTDKQTEAIRAINQRIATDSRVEAVMLAVGDGLTFARKK